MTSAHSASTFRGSCVIQPRHPKTRLPTTAIERKSFDFSGLAQQQQGSLSDDTSGTTSSNENGKNANDGGHRNRKSSQLQRSKSSKRPNSTKRKNLSKSVSKSVSVGCEPQGINYSRYNSKRLIDTKTLSVGDDLFFRHLQALKEENKRALKTLERLYQFGQEDDVEVRKNVNFKNVKNKCDTNKVNSDEGITSDSNASLNSHENEHASENLIENNTAEQREERPELAPKECDNGDTGAADMPAQSLVGNYIYGFTGDQLLKVADSENVYSQNGYSGNDRLANPYVEGKYSEHHRHSVSVDNGYHDDEGQNTNLENGYTESDRHNLDLENGYPEHVQDDHHSENEYSFDEAQDDEIENNIQDKLRNGYNGNGGVGNGEHHALENGYVENNRGSHVTGREHGVKDARNGSYDNGYGRNGRRQSLNTAGNGTAHHNKRVVYSSQVQSDFVANLGRRAQENREIRHASDSSEDELDEKLKVRPPASHVNILPESERGFRGRQSNYDVIANMWNDFSVNDTVPYSRNIPGRGSIKKKQGWSPGVTVQAPFNMTLREEKMKGAKQKKIERIKDELLQKKLAEEAELKKRVTPIPIPPSTFLPIFSEKQQQEQRKKKQMKQISKQILKSTEKPFSFLEREQQKIKLKRSQSMNAKIDTSKSAKFRANPYPDKLFDLTWKDKEAEQAEYRKIKIKLRSQELLASSSLPPNMKTRGGTKQLKNESKTKRGNKNSPKKKKKEQPSFQPQVHHSIPDFQEMQKKIEMALEARKNQNTPTICEPFNLHTAQVPSRRSRFEQSVEKTKPPNPPTSSRPGSSFSRSNTITGVRDGYGTRHGERRPSSNVSLTRSRSTSAHSGRLSRSRSVSPVYSVTEAARLRQEHIRQSVEKEKQENMRKNEEKKQKQKEISRLQKMVAQKTAAHDPTRFRERQTAEKLASFRRAEKERAQEYKEFLRSVDQKNEQRPLLFERESQTNAKRQAQRRYEEILRRAGIDGKTLEAFIAGDRDIHRQLSQQNNNSGSEEDESDEEEDDDDDDEDEEDDIPLKSDGMGYDVVLKSNNNSRSYENDSDEESEGDELGVDGENDDVDDDDDDDGEEDESGGDDDDDDVEEDDGVVRNIKRDVDSDDGSYKAS